MVKLSYFLPQASDPVAMKMQLFDCGVLDLTNELIYRMAPEAVDPAILSRSSLTIRQYTRSALKLLRYDLLSNNPPLCMNNIKLKTLDIWKSNILNRNKEFYDEGSMSSNGNRNNSFRQPPCRSRSFNDGKRSYASSNHLMPQFIVRKQKQSTHAKENNIDHKSELLEMNSKHIGYKAGDNIESSEFESKQNPVLNADGIEILSTADKKAVEKSDTKRKLPQTNPFIDQQDGDDEGSTDGKNIIHSPVISLKTELKTNSDLAGETSQNSGINRDDRRIGSGRLSFGKDKEWQYFNKDNNKTTIANNYQQDDERNSSANRFNNFHNRRRYDSYSSKSNTSNDEPEWFSAGPTSRLEVIELHGFDDDCSSTASDHNSKNGITSVSAEKSTINNKKDDEIASVTTSQSSPPPARSTPTKYGHKKHQNQAQNEFMFDTFYNPFANAMEDDKKPYHIEPRYKPRCSRLCDTDIPDQNLPRNWNPPANRQFYDNLVHNSNGKNKFYQQNFHNNNNNHNYNNNHNHTRGQLPYYVANVEELEAKMFHTGKTNQENLMQMLANMNNKQYHNQQYEDKENFKSLINQMASTSVGKTINFYQEQQQQDLLKHRKQDIMRVADILQKFAAYSLTAVPISQMNRADILNRPEAQALLQAIAHHEITINSLVYILNNTGVVYAPGNPIFEYNRDIIWTVLNFIEIQKQQQHAEIQRQSRLCLMNKFPFISKNLPQRIPSVRELQFHTQSILQSALLRKKMEMQKNKKHPLNETFGEFLLNSSLTNAASSRSSHSNNNNFQPQFKSFTPTSVLKNISADNKNDSMWQKCLDSTELISDNGEIQNKFDFNGNVSHSGSNLEQPEKHIQWIKPEIYKPNNMKSIGRSILKKSTYQTTPNNETILNLQSENLIEFETHHQDETTYSNMSPAKKQLSEWFTPELLTQASAGKSQSLNKNENEVGFLKEFEKNNTHES